MALAIIFKNASTTDFQRNLLPVPELLLQTHAKEGVKFCPLIPRQGPGFSAFLKGQNITRTNYSRKVHEIESGSWQS